MSRHSVLTAVLAVLLFAFSITQLGLSGYVLSFVSDRSKYNRDTFVFTITATHLSYDFYFLPLYSITRSFPLQLATAALGAVIAVVVLGLLIRSRPLSVIGTGKKAPRTIRWPIITIVLGVLLFALALPNLVISMYDNSKYGASTIQMGILLAEHSCGATCSGNLELYNVMSIEGWTCEMFDVYGSFNGVMSDAARNALHKTCTISTLARWWTVPLIILPLLLAAIALLEIRHQNIARYQPRDELNAGLNAAKESSMSSSEGRNTMPPGYCERCELHGNSETRPEVAGKEVVEAPESKAHDELPAQEHQICSELSADKTES